MKNVLILKRILAASALATGINLSAQEEGKTLQATLPQTPREGINFRLDMAPSFLEKGVEMGLDYSFTSSFSMGFVASYFSKGVIRGEGKSELTDEKKDLKITGNAIKLGLRPTYYFQEAFRKGFYLSGIFDYKLTQGKELTLGDEKTTLGIYQSNIENKKFEYTVHTLSLGGVAGYQHAIANNINLDFGLGLASDLHFLAKKTTRSIPIYGFSKEEIDFETTTAFNFIGRASIGFMF